MNSKITPGWFREQVRLAEDDISRWPDWLKTAYEAAKAPIAGQPCEAGKWPYEGPGFGKACETAVPDQPADRVAFERNYKILYPDASFVDALHDGYREESIDKAWHLWRSATATLTKRESGWQDISTAPKDGYILGAIERSDVRIIHWNNGIWAGAGLNNIVTHWMPLPELPRRGSDD